MTSESEKGLRPLFRRVFKSTDDPEVVAAFCSILGQHGEYTEEAQLKEKLASTKESGIVAIKSALRKIDLWKRGDPTRLGGAAIRLPPH